MTTSLRYTKITNTTGEVVAPGGATINKGQDYATETVDVTFSDADIGDQAGQTRHAQGMLFAEFNGSFVKGIVSATLFRTDEATYGINLGTDEYNPRLALNVVNSPTGSTVRFIDAGSNVSVQARAGDRMIVTFALGNS